jgi:phosphoglycolate phosphatase
MTMVCTVIGWDADGVVIDSRAVAWRAAEDIVGLFGPRLRIASPKDNAAAFGRAAQARFVGDDGAAVLRSLHRLVMRSRAGEVGLFNDILRVVAGLTAPPPLITAAYAEGVRRALGPSVSLFSSVVGREEGNKEALIAAAAAAGMTWFVTDTVRDLRRCRDFGVATIGVTWGYDHAEDLAAASPDILVHNASQLAAALVELSFLKSSLSSKGVLQ